MKRHLKKPLIVLIGLIIIGMSSSLAADPIQSFGPDGEPGYWLPQEELIGLINDYHTEVERAAQWKAEYEKLLEDYNKCIDMNLSLREENLKVSGDNMLWLFAGAGGTVVVFGIGLLAYALR